LLSNEASKHPIRMTEQPSIDAMERALQPTDRLFFAIYRDTAAARRIERLAQRLRGELGLKGRPIVVERLRVTICYLGNRVGVPQIVDAARGAAGSVVLPRVKAAFDRAASFVGRRGKRRFVRLGGEGPSALKALQHILRDVFARAGLGGGDEQPYTPHVSLLYDTRGVDEIAVDAVSWTARELVLVRSLLGQGKHVTLRRWPLHNGGAPRGPRRYDSGCSFVA
jgi:2'-5' RNA ligase